MDNDKAIALQETSYFSPSIWNQMKEMATVFIQSKALPAHIQNTAQAMVVMQAGYEMGMKPMESFKSLYMVNGQITLWGSSLARRLREHGWDIQYKAGTERGGSMSATVTNKKLEQSITDVVYFESAEKSGYTTANGNLKVGWREGLNRELKLRYLVISKIVKTYIPEVLGAAVDIKEVAEDYPQEEIEKIGKTDEKPKTEVIKTGEKTDLKDFLNKEKQNRNVPDQDIERKRYFAVAKNAGMDSDTAKNKIKEDLKVESFNDIGAQALKDYTDKLDSVPLPVEEAEVAK